MIQKLIKWTIALVFIAPSFLWASEQFEISSFSEFESSAFGLIKDYKPHEVLVVFDIDNTLLTMSESMGSDQWWNWQSAVLKSTSSDSDKLTAGLVSTDFATLLSIQGFLFKSLPMLTIESTQYEVLKRLQRLNLPVIALTSRGPEFQAATYRELFKYGFNFKPTALTEINDDYLPRLPYNKSELDKVYGFSSKEISEYRLGNPRKVLYQDGVFLTAGQHKGAMLRILLKDRQIQPKLILFVDDHKKNTNAMWSAYIESNTEIFTYRYGFLDSTVYEFQKSNKTDVIQRWNQLKPYYAQDH